MEQPVEAVSVDVGRKLRQMREEQQFTIRGLARVSGLSANALSMIERGKASPSVSTLYKIADALGVSITQFFGEQPARRDAVLVRAAERTRVPFPRGVWEGLGGEGFTGRVEPFMLTLESGASSGKTIMAHTGHEFVYCLRGNLQYTVQKEAYDLEAGDSLLFAAHLQHKWRNPGGRVTNVLVVLSGFAEPNAPHTLNP